MESLSQQLERFSEVLAASRTPHVRSWDPAAVRRALQWARYMRHVYRRFGRHAGIRLALERRLQDHWRREDGSGPAAAAATFSGLTGFRALGRCDLLLSQRLLGNPALGGPAFRCLLGQLCPGPGARVAEEEEETLQDRLALLARRRAAVHLLRSGGLGERPAAPEDPLVQTQAQEDPLVQTQAQEDPLVQTQAQEDPLVQTQAQEDPLVQTQAELLLQRLREVGEAGAEGPRRLLSGLWERLPRDGFLGVIAAALLLPSLPPGPPEKESEPDSPRTPGEGRHELVQWLLGKPDTMAAFCHSLPAGILASVVGRHPELLPGYLALLTDWGRRLRYDLQKGIWVGAEESRDGPWDELLGRFQSLCQAPSPLREEVLRALETCKAQDGGFEVPGLSIWTDLLLVLGSAA